MKTAMFVLLFLFCQSSFASFEKSATGGRSVGMGGSLVGLSSDVWGAFGNPSGFAGVLDRSLSLFMTPGQFGMTELSRMSFSYVEPTGLGIFALSGNRFGFDLYRETTVGVSYSSYLLPDLGTGITLNYHSLTIQNYGTASTLSVDLGLLVDLTDAASWGFAVSNITNSSIGKLKERLPQVFSTGIAYRPITDLHVVLNVVKEVRHPMELQAGVEYRILDLVALRGGTSTEPSTMNVGIGLSYSFVNVDYALSTHAELGSSHHFSLILNLGDL